VKRSVRAVAGRLGLVLGATLALTSVAVAPVLAGAVEIHTGAYGVHAAIDNTEYAGAKCQYANQQLDAITIRQPILFARDRTGGTDTQKVGWAFTIQYATDIGGTTWADYTNSPIVAHTATDKVNAHFKPRTWHLTNVVYTNSWRVINQFYWYYPDVNHESGRAYHVVYHYQVEDQVSSGNWCPDSQPKITVRQPIAFAFDRSGLTDTQTVGWRYTVQWTDGNVWHALATTSTVKDTATDGANADWQPRTFTFSNAPTHGYYRVVLRVVWYQPGSSTTAGLARHPVSLYRLIGSGFAFTDLACARTAGS
jgi:hypothetical protein